MWAVSEISPSPPSNTPLYPQVTYTSLIQIYGRSLHWRAAQAVFHEALRASESGGCAVGVVMFNALAAAYAESGCFQRLWDLVMTEMVQEYGVKPDRCAVCLKVSLRTFLCGCSICLVVFESPMFPVHWVERRLEIGPSLQIEMGGKDLQSIP